MSPDFVTPGGFEAGVHNQDRQTHIRGKKCDPGSGEHASAEHESLGDVDDNSKHARNYGRSKSSPPPAKYRHKTI
jgi:hypothetical protein